MWNWVTAISKGDSFCRQIPSLSVEWNIYSGLGRELKSAMLRSCAGVLSKWPHCGEVTKPPGSLSAAQYSRIGVGNCSPRRQNPACHLFFFSYGPHAKCFFIFLNGWGKKSEIEYVWRHAKTMWILISVSINKVLLEYSWWRLGQNILYCKLKEFEKTAGAGRLLWPSSNPFFHERGHKTLTWEWPPYTRKGDLFLRSEGCWGES